MTQFACSVEAFWDPDVNVWVATSEDVPGLATEAPTMEALTDKLRVMIPELVLLNHFLSKDDADSINFCLTSFAEFPIRHAVGMDSDGVAAPICCC